MVRRPWEKARPVPRDDFTSKPVSFICTEVVSDPESGWTRMPPEPSPSPPQPETQPPEPSKKAQPADAMSMPQEVVSSIAVWAVT